ncbi:MAG: TadE/TadG family type IV pilus assembly protein [Polyangiaceae bacterium]|nr:TadE/TadG family type IV pilus assembly protein [Polyangiaceae bacterium]
MKDLRSERGVASVEAVILLPIFLLLFFGILYVARVNDAKLVALTEARSQAWIASMQSCEGSSAEQNQQHPEAKGVHDAVGKALTPSTQSTSNTTSLPIGGVIGKILNAPLKTLFGESVTTHASRTVPRPAFLGGKEATVVGSYRLPCNLKPQTLWDVASSLWDAIWPF